MKFFKLNKVPLNDRSKADFFATFSLKNLNDESYLQKLAEEFKNKAAHCKSQYQLNRIQKAYFLKYDQSLNQSTNEAQLNQKGVAETVNSTLQEFEGSLYHILAYTIMPNHIHFLFKLKKPETDDLNKQVEGILQLLKEQINHNIGQYLNLGNNIWVTFNCEHHLMLEKEVINLTSYLVEDPVKAGLVDYWKDYPHTYINPELM